MSAWLCSENHINLIANVATQSDPVKGRAAFNLLRSANLRSLSARYPGRDFLDEWKREAKQYRFTPSTPQSHEIANADKATLIVKQCDCFDYQACESDDYDGSKAAQLVETVRKLALKAGGVSDGALYDAQPWGID
jgi:hypothetical protein